MVRATINLTRKQEMRFKARAERLAYSVNGYIKRLILDELARLAENDPPEVADEQD